MNIDTAFLRRCIGTLGLPLAKSASTEKRMRSTTSTAPPASRSSNWCWSRRSNWTAHGKAASFRRNDDLLNLMPKGLTAFPGSGITGNLVDKARQFGIPVLEVAA